MKFTIKGRLPSLNDIIESSRGNKHAANNNKKKAQQYIQTFIPNGRMKCPCNVHVTFYEPDNRRDIDNIVSAGCKLIFDALVWHGTIPNDNRRWIKQMHPLVFTDRDNPRIEVELRPARLK